MINWLVKIASNIPASLQGLASEAIKCTTFEEFKKSFLRDIKHGTYWHITDNPNFTIDPTMGPRDMSSMGMGSASVGSLMVTSDLMNWHSSYNYDPSGKKNVQRPYAALIDLSNIPSNQYGQIGRGFGNEFMISDASQAKVVAVYPIEKAIQINKYRHSKLPQNEDQLREFYNKAHPYLPSNAEID